MKTLVSAAGALAINLLGSAVLLVASATPHAPWLA